MKTISEKPSEVSVPSQNEGEGSLCYETVGSDSKASLSAYSRTDFMNAPVQQAIQGDGFFRRMPCKARGVPGEHVARNAYIDIPLHAKHGCLLSCSHPTCRLSGRRFRFCAVCQVPVAKRNFARRHTHGLSLMEINSSTASDLDVSLAGSATGSYASATKTVHKETTRKLNSAFPPKVVSSSNLSQSVERKIPGEISVASGLEKATETIMTSDMTSVAMSMEEYSINGRKKQQNQRTAIYVSEDELDWLYLFRQRPGLSESKEAWLKRVEQVGGVSLKSKNFPTRKSQKRFSVEDEELSDIEPTGEDGLGNFDSSNMEDLFE
mmetsp:Transcript_7748/g.8859  ORF Transcript_7748/g.8859 Transcript_7748/m.8859 type:complete len:322 (+) Transcript_7748:65-1030(+)